MAVFYNTGALQQDNGTRDYLTGEIRIAVVLNTFVVDVADATVLAALAGGQEATNFGVRKTLGTKTVVLNETPTPNQLEFRGDATLTYTSVAAGETVGGLLFYWHVTDDTDSVPFFFDDSTSNPTTNGNNVDFTQPADGWAHSPLIGSP